MALFVNTDERQMKRKSLKNIYLFFINLYQSILYPYVHILSITVDNLTRLTFLTDFKMRRNQFDCIFHVRCVYIVYIYVCHIRIRP